MKTIIRGSRVVDPTQALDDVCDILVVDGKIEAIEKKGAFDNVSDVTIDDASGMTAVPGLVDMHVHLRDPGNKNKESIRSGSEAALSGGITSVACMPNTLPVNDNSFITGYMMEKSRELGLCKVRPIGAISRGLLGEELANIGGMVEAGAVGISDDGNPVMNSYLMRKAMDYAKPFDIPIISHAEDSALSANGVMHQGYYSNVLGLRGIPSESEEIMVARDIALAKHTGAKLHIAHVSSRYSVEHIRKAKEDGLSVTAEVTPHHLWFTDDAIVEYDSNFKMKPPLRESEDREALREALREGVIDAVATDHAPHLLEEKEVEFQRANDGVIGLETSLSAGLRLVEQGVLDLSTLVERMSCTPARILKLEAGSLRKGMPADITIVDSQKEFTYDAEGIVSKSRNSSFLGVRFKGRVARVYVDGRKVFEY